MSRVLAAVLFALGSTGLELTLVVLHAPIVLLFAGGLALFATGVLLVSWHPAAMAASIALYLTAAAIGLVAFSPVGLAVSGV
jgi:hypothetical protein